jgi:hypothetical protein
MSAVQPLPPIKALIEVVTNWRLGQHEELERLLDLHREVDECQVLIGGLITFAGLMVTLLEEGGTSYEKIIFYASDRMEQAYRNRDSRES